MTTLTVGTKVRYNGDVANHPKKGTVIEVEEMNKWTGMPSYKIQFEDDEAIWAEHRGFIEHNGRLVYEVIRKERLI